MSVSCPSQDDLIPTRDSLITRLKDWEDQAGWKEFFDTYSKLIFAVAIRAGLTETEAHEAVQETVITVAKNIEKFKTGAGHGSFKGWLLNTTRWRIADQFRKRGVQWDARGRRLGGDGGADGTTWTPTVERIPDPKGSAVEAVWEHEWAQYRSEAALARLKRNVGSKPFQIFHLLVARRLPANEVAKTLGISRALVYVTKHLLSPQFKRELKRIDREVY